MNEDADVRRREGPSLMSHLIARRESTGFESPYTFFHSGGELLALFSSREAARRHLAADDLGDGWCVREYAGGEFVSPLFVLHEGLSGILLDPSSGRRLQKQQVLWWLGDRGGFIEFLISV